MSRILLADDQPVMLKGLAAMLELNGHMVVAQCSTVPDAISAEQAHKPDLVIADHGLRPLSGLSFLEQLRQAGNQIDFILYTGQISSTDARRAIDSGTNAIVSKCSSPDDIIDCIHAVQRGQNWFDRTIMTAAMAKTKGPEAWSKLSPAERRIAMLAVEGLHNREIADQTGLVEGTIKVHMNRIFRKLGISSRLALMRHYREVD